MDQSVQREKFSALSRMKSTGQAAEQFYVTWPWIMCFYRQETELGLTWAPALADCMKICPYLTCTNIQVLVSVPEIIKTWLFRGQHELLRKKKSLHTTLGDTDFNYFLYFQSQFPKVWIPFPTKKILSWGFFSLPSSLENAPAADAIWLVHPHVVHWSVFIHFWIFVLQAVLVSGLQISGKAEAQRHEAREISLAVTPQTSRTPFKIWPCIMFPSPSLAAKAALQSWAESF